MVSAANKGDGTQRFRKCFPVVLRFLLVVLPGLCAGAPAAASSHHATDPVTLPSGVYGFSGVSSAFGEGRRGVIGACVWIYDAANRKLVTTGHCPEDNPGRFRVQLPPGRYVVRGPGGNETIQVRPNSWTKLESIKEVPSGP